MTNIEGVRSIRHIFDWLRSRTRGRPYESLIEFVSGKPGHNRCYAIDSNRIERDQGWKAGHDFRVGIGKAVRWCHDDER